HSIPTELPFEYSKSESTSFIGPRKGSLTVTDLNAFSQEIVYFINRESLGHHLATEIHCPNDPVSVPNNFLIDKRIIPVVPVAVLDFTFKIYALSGTILKNSAFALTLRRVTV